MALAGLSPDAKTPEEAKGKIRDMLIRSQALTTARTDANEFASTVFALTNAGAENLVTVAKEKKLKVQTTAPFAAETGPQEFFHARRFCQNRVRVVGGRTVCQSNRQLQWSLRHCPCPATAQ